MLQQGPLVSELSADNPQISKDCLLIYLHRYGSEDKLATLMGVMQALVSFVQVDKNTIR